MKKLLLALALAAAAATAAPAQTVPAPTPGQESAALVLVDAMNMQVTLQQSLDTMLEMQLQQNPQLRPLEGVMREFFSRYMSWDRLRGDYARLYARTFTEAELRAMTVFYRSPVGQKMARVTPQLMAEAAKLGEQAVQANLPELQQMIMAEMQRQQGTGATPAP